MNELLFCYGSLFLLWMLGMTFIVCICMVAGRADERAGYK